MPNERDDPFETPRSAWSRRKRLLHRTALLADRVTDGRWRALRRRLGHRPPLYLLPFRGWTNGREAWLCGRAIEGKPPGGPAETDTWWDNLRNTLRRWKTSELAGVEVRASLGGRTETAVSDDEGYFEFRFPLPRGSDPDAGEWAWLDLAVPDPPEKGHARSGPITAKGPLLAPPETATYGVISDLDDTIIHTSITDLWTAAKLTFLNNARTRQPLEGVAALYHAFHHGPPGPDRPQHNPIFYVSSSAWNLYDLLRDFLELNGLPEGPILLRDVGIDETKFIKTGHRHKLDKANRIMADFPRLPFVLVGDSSQMDPWLYVEAVRRHGPRIRAVYIRDVNLDRDSQREAEIRGLATEAADLGVPFVLVRDSVEAARHAAEIGLIDAAEIASVEADRRHDHAQPGEARDVFRSSASGRD